MKTLGVIGNSHLAALKLGWNHIKRGYPDLELAFFGKPLAQQNEIKRDGEWLIAADDAVAEKFLRATGRSRLSMKYDGYIICDLGITARSVVDFCRVYQPEGFSSPAPIPVSLPCFRSSVYGIFEKSFAISLVRQLRTLTDVPIALVPAPMRSTDHPDPDRKRLEDHGDAEKIAEAFNGALRRLAEDLNLRLFLQTGATLASPLRTHQPFTRAHVRIQRHETALQNATQTSADAGSENADPGSVPLVDAGGASDEPAEFSTIEKDFGHMNARYGYTTLRLVLENFGFLPLKALQAESAEPTKSVPSAEEHSLVLPPPQPEYAGWLSKFLHRKR